MDNSITLYDPVIIGLVAVAAVTQVMSGIAVGNLANEQAKAESSFITAQIYQVQKQADRDQADLAKEKKKVSARARAVLAASGASTQEGTGLALLTSSAAQFGRMAARMQDDTQVQIASLTARSRTVKAVGAIQRTNLIFGGVANAMGTIGSASMMRKPGGGGGGTQSNFGGGRQGPV